jgi:hypothetical protein
LSKKQPKTHLKYIIRIISVNIRLSLEKGVLFIHWNTKSRYPKYPVDTAPRNLKLRFKIFRQ